MKDIAQRCERFSGADLAALVKEAKLRALTRDLETNADKDSDKNKDDYYSTNRYYREDDDLDEEESPPVVTLHDFELALSKVKPSVTEKDEHKYHELGKRQGKS